MSSTRDLIQDLRRQGVHLKWGARGVTVSGDLGRLTRDYELALQERRSEVIALVRWSALQEESVQRFGHPGAAFYPFLRFKLDRAPVVRTTEGPARVAQVLSDSLRVVMEEDMAEWRRSCLRSERKLPLPPMVDMGFDQVFPPATFGEETRTGGLF